MDPGSPAGNLPNRALQTIKNYKFVHNFKHVFSGANRYSAEEVDGLWLSRKNKTGGDILRTAYKSKACESYKRNLIRGPNLRHMLVQYLYDGPVVEFQLPPHGNRKHGTQPYTRTYASTKSGIKDSGRKKSLDLMTEQRISVAAAEHLDDNIRNKKQVAPTAVLCTKSCSKG